MFFDSFDQDKTWDPYFIEVFKKTKFTAKKTVFLMTQKLFYRTSQNKTCYGGLNVYTSISLNQLNLEPHILFSDAFDEGFPWGTRDVISLLDGSVQDFTQGNWSPIESSCHINVKEIMAVKFALFSFFPDTSNSVIGVHCDNSSVMT